MICLADLTRFSMYLAHRPLEVMGFIDLVNRTSGPCTVQDVAGHFGVSPRVARYALLGLRELGYVCLTDDLVQLNGTMEALAR